jgi:predicted RND superfamily exporter protein
MKLYFIGAFFFLSFVGTQFLMFEVGREHQLREDNKTIKICTDSLEYSVDTLDECVKVAKRQDEIVTSLTEAVTYCQKEGC